MSMTKVRNQMAAIAAALVTLALLASGQAGAAQGPTISDFALKVYKGSLSRQDAMAALRAAVPALQSPDARLTESSLAEILTAFGVHSTTRRPGLEVDQGRADAAILFIWQSASGAGGRGGASGNSSGGPIDLASCVSGGNIWTCMQCCLSQGTPAGSCGHFCAFGVSPSVP
jgi:hypothetical protein